MTTEGPRVHHVTLTVTDPDASARWYRALLGEAEVTLREGLGFRRVRLRWPNGFVLGLTRHDGTGADDAFDALRVGLDHLGILCDSEEEVRAWARRMDDLGVAHGPVEEAAYAWAVTARDPDGIAVELFCPRS